MLISEKCERHERKPPGQLPLNNELPGLRGALGNAQKQVDAGEPVLGVRNCEEVKVGGLSARRHGGSCASGNDF